MSIAIYALSGDPITFGHLDIIERTSKLFEKVIVAIGYNPDKKYLFSIEERANIAKESLDHLSNIEVKYFEGLLVDFAYQEKASVIIRGVRNSNDFEFEFNINQVNQTQLELETFLLFANERLGHISSSNVKALQKENGFIHEYVPLPVKVALEDRISGQKIIGVTGLMGSGKSWISEQLESYSKDKEVEVHNIDLDVLAKEISTSTKAGYVAIQDKIEEYFGTMDRAVIGKKVFDTSIPFKDNKALQFINNVYKDAIMIELRKALRGKKGIILLNSAILIESEFLDLCNNKVVMVQTEDSLRYEMVKEGRGIDSDTVKERSAFVLSKEDKVKQVNNSIEQHNYGNLLIVNNKKGIDISEVYKSVLSL